MRGRGVGLASGSVTRSSSRAGNILVSELAVMGDAESNLTAKLEAFMEALSMRQQTLEQQVAEIAAQVCDSRQESRGGDNHGASNEWRGDRRSPSGMDNRIVESGRGAMVP